MIGEDLFLERLRVCFIVESVLNLLVGADSEDINDST